MPDKKGKKKLLWLLVSCVLAVPLAFSCTPTATPTPTSPLWTTPTAPPTTTTPTSTTPTTPTTTSTPSATQVVLAEMFTGDW